MQLQHKKTENVTDSQGDVREVTQTKKPIEKVDFETAEVLKATAEKKTQEIVQNNNAVSSEISNEIEKEIKFNRANFEYIEGIGYMDTVNGTGIYETEEELNTAEQAALNKVPTDALPVDVNINEKDIEDTTDIIKEPIQEDIEVPVPEDNLKTASPDVQEQSNLYPNVATMGVDRSGPTAGKFSQWILEPFRNFINNFKDITGTPVTFSQPSYLSEDNKKAIEILNNKSYLTNEANLDFLYRNYPIQVNIDENTFTFIPSFHPSLSDNTTFQGRKNIVDAIISNNGVEGLKSTIKYQKGGTLVYNKTVDANGNIVTENKISSLKEFQDDITKAPLYFVKDEKGDLYDEKGNLIDGLDSFPSILKNAYKQKGYIYTIIHSPGGIKVPVKLNVRKLNNNQAEMIYEVYKSLHDYNQTVPSNERLTQYVAKLNDLYSLNPELKSIIETNFSKELSLFKKVNDITVADFMTLFIHDNVTIEGETKPYTTKYAGGQILAGQEGLLNFNEDSPMSKDEFINFLITQKRQNTKISYLAGENSNIKSNEYKKYLLEDITNVNIDTQQPFKGDINIYIDSNITLPEKPVIVKPSQPVSPLENKIQDEILDGTTYQLIETGDTLEHYDANNKGFNQVKIGEKIVFRKRPGFIEFSDGTSTSAVGIEYKLPKVDLERKIRDKYKNVSEVDVKKNQENIRNSEKNVLSSLPDPNTTSGIDISQVKTVKKTKRMTPEQKELFNERERLYIRNNELQSKSEMTDIESNEYKDNFAKIRRINPKLMGFPRNEGLNNINKKCN